MPTVQPDNTYWQPDFRFMATVPGAAELEQWFGFTTDFHDGELSNCDLDGTSARLQLAAFRMTSKTDAAGLIILDRRANVTIYLENVREVCLDGDIPTTVLELGFRPANEAGDELLIEVAWDDVCGGGGTILAGTARIEFEPAEKAA